jgi:hypothetical protein
MSKSGIHNLLNKLALPETTDRKYPLSEAETNHLSEVINACECSESALIFGIQGVSSIIAVACSSEATLGNIDGTELAQANWLISEISEQIISMQETRSSAKYVMEYNTRKLGGAS